MHHRAYQPALPCANKYLQQKWDKSDYDMHRGKVASAKSTIDLTPPKIYGHLRRKLKKRQLEEDRVTIIQRDNNMLMEKISHIMRTTGRIDNRNEYDSKREKRIQELKQVTKDNQEIYHRLSRCVSQYSVRKWHEDWLQSNKYIESVTRYPQHVTLSQGHSKIRKEKETKSQRGGDNTKGSRAKGDMKQRSDCADCRKMKKTGKAKRCA